MLTDMKKARFDNCRHFVACYNAEPFDSFTEICYSDSGTIVSQSVSLTAVFYIHSSMTPNVLADSI